MDIRVRRALLPALLAAALLLVAGWHAVPAGAASVDPELVAESVSEDGYYVDSGASYLKSDADLDKLRAALNDAGRAGVVVLPAGTASGPVISRLLQEPNRKATYVVLTGSNLQAASNNMPSSKVKGLLSRAKRAGEPKAEVLAFLDLLGGKHPAVKPKKKASEQPSPGVSNGTEGAAAPSTSPVASAKKDSGGNGMLYAIIGIVIVLAAAGGGFLLWRRRQGETLPPPPPVA
jgi:hypothetical protein